MPKRARHVLRPPDPPPPKIIRNNPNTDDKLFGIKRRNVVRLKIIRCALILAVLLIVMYGVTEYYAEEKVTENVIMNIGLIANYAKLTGKASGNDTGFVYMAKTPRKPYSYTMSLNSETKSDYNELLTVIIVSTMSDLYYHQFKPPTIIPYSSTKASTEYHFRSSSMDINGHNRNYGKTLKKIATTPRDPDGHNYLTSTLTITDLQMDPVRVNARIHITKIETVDVIEFKKEPACSTYVSSHDLLFWSVPELNTIEVMDLKTYQVRSLVEELQNPGSIATDPAMTLLFYCTHGNNGSIGKIHFNGTNRLDKIHHHMNFSHPTGLAVDLYGKELYWIANDALHKSDYNGGTRCLGTDKSILLSYSRVGVDCIAFSVHLERLYYRDQYKIDHRHNNREFSNNLVSISFKSTTAPCGLQTDNESRCTNWTCLTNSAGLTCYCVSYKGNVNGSDDENRDDIDVARTLLNITLTSIEGSIPVKNMSELTPEFGVGVFDGLLQTGTFDFDSRSHQIFYYDSTVKQIRSINTLAEKKVPIMIVENITIPNNGLAYDWMTNDLLFIDSEEKNIKALGLNSSMPNEIIRAEMDSSINSIAVHSQQSLMFFIRQRKYSKTINKSTMTGKNVSTVTSIDLSALDVIVVDPVKNVIYWINDEYYSIERIDFDGKAYRITKQLSSVYPFITELSRSYDLTHEIMEHSLVASKFKRQRTPADRISRRHNSYFKQILMRMKRRKRNH